MNHRKTIREYYNTFKNADKEALQKILIPGFTHLSEFAVYTARDDMIEDIWPTVGQTRAENLQIFGTHPEFMVRYKVVGGERPSRNMSEYIRFEGDKIAEIEVFMGREV